MRILGIDPGTIVCGYGVIDIENRKMKLVEYGVVEAKKQYAELPRRLEVIYQRLTSVIERTLPDEAALEAVFFAKNAQSLAKLSHARGVAMLSATLKEIPVTEYSAKEVKRSVTGNGNAAKEQVCYMVRKMLGIEETPDFFDATDALAIAVCHALKRNENKTKAKSWKKFLEENPQRVARVRQTKISHE
jgi:crossover junction endodeoxyribonuclease RuvC